MDLSNVIEELAATLAELTPPVNVQFRTPASESEIAEAESAIGLSFPADLVAVLRNANGQHEPGMHDNPLFPCLRFRDPLPEGGHMSSFTSHTWLNGTDEIVEMTNYHRAEYEELDCSEAFVSYGPAKYHPNVIAITTTENADSLVLDMEPTTGGTVGQVVCVCTQPFEVAVIEPSLQALLERILKGYKFGQMQFDTDWPVWAEK